MRIAIDMTYPNKIKTGIHTYTDNLLETIRKFDKRNQYIFVSAPTVFKKKKFLIGLINVLIDILWRQVFLPYKIGKWKIDVLHSPCFFAPFLLPCSLVVTAYDTTYLYYPEIYNSLWLSYFRYSVLFAVKRANKVIAISNYTKKDILGNFDVSPEKVRVIYGGVASKFTQIKNRNALDRFREKYGLNYKVILSVCELNSRKNIPTLLRAFYLFKKMQDDFERVKYKLVLCGQKGNAFGTILSLTEKLNLTNDVIFLGHIPDDDLPLLYNVATLFIFPSLYEGFGLPPLEAMACGCPVIASNASSLPEVVGEAGILTDPLDSQGFANAMKRITTDDSLREGLIKKGIERARLFSWEKAAKETLVVYSQACTEKTR